MTPADASIRGRWRIQIRELLDEMRMQGVPCDAGSADRIQSFCEAIEAWAARTNLVSRQDLPLLVTKHVAPSLGPLWIEPPRDGERWIDVGTGGGFPGMILKICRPSLRITLLDSSRKKTVFLEHVRSALQLEDLEIREARVEALDDVFDVIVMRAVAPLERAIPLLTRVSRSGSRFVTFKGPGWKDELATARSTLVSSGWDHRETRQLPWAQPKVMLFCRG